MQRRIKKGSVKRLIGHAVLCIGHEIIDGNSIKGTSFVEYSLKKGNGKLKVRDWDNIPKKFIFVDDNFPVYQSESLDEPTRRYLDIPEQEYPNRASKEKADKEWSSCKISHFIVPLYKKFIWKATWQRLLSKSCLFLIFLNMPMDERFVYELFCAQPSSYRKYIMFSNMPQNLKALIMSKSFPKFVWITEVSDESIPSGEAKGLIILDATEANTLDYRPLIFAMCNGFVVQYDKSERSIKSSQGVGGSFAVFDNNLKKL